MEIINVNDLEQDNNIYDKEYYFNLFSNILKTMPHKMICLLWMLALVTTIILDLVPCRYVWIFKDIFDYNLSNLVAVLVVVWTFVTTIIGYWINKAENYLYGVKVIHLLIQEYGIPKIAKFIEVIILQLVVLIIIVIGEMPITATFLAIFLVYTVVFAFLSFFVIPTKYNLYKQIKKEIYTFGTNQKRNASDTKKEQKQEFLSKLLHDALKGMNNSKEPHEDDVLEILNLIPEEISKKLSDSKNFQQKKEIYEGCKLIVDDILKFEWNSEKNYLFFRNWINIENVPFELKQAIVAVLLEDGASEKYNTLEHLLATEFIHFRQLYVWTIVYTLYCKSANGANWKYLYIARLENKFNITWQKKDVIQAINDWKLIHGENVKNFHALFDYIQKRWREWI